LFQRKFPRNRMLDNHPNNRKMSNTLSQDEIASRGTQKYTNFLTVNQLEILLGTRDSQYVSIGLKPNLS
jgi:hypothetical protein